MTPEQSIINNLPLKLASIALADVGPYVADIFMSILTSAKCELQTAFS